jgi:hypothetical protein
MALLATTVRYGFSILPGVTRELAHWRALAGEIPDPALRRLALRALDKRGNMQGAALFAVLAPAPAAARRWAASHPTRSSPAPLRGPVGASSTSRASISARGGVAMTC